MEAAGDANMAIFKNIAEIIHDSEFNDASYKFFQLHCKSFEDDVEENKHEYKQIYESYLAITEKVIETKLREKYQLSDDAILDFYSTFADHRKEYEQEDADTVDTLFGMIEFDDFKRRMVEAKKGMTDTEGSTADSEGGGSSLIDPEQEWAAFCALREESVTDKTIGWKKKSDR